MGIRQRTLLIRPPQAVDSGRGLAALHNLAETRGTLEPAPASWSAASPLPLSQVRWQALIGIR